MLVFQTLIALPARIKMIQLGAGYFLRIVRQSVDRIRRWKIAVVVVVAVAGRRVKWRVSVAETVAQITNWSVAAVAAVQITQDQIVLVVLYLQRESSLVAVVVVVAAAAAAVVVVGRSE